MEYNLWLFTERTGSHGAIKKIKHTHKHSHVNERIRNIYLRIDACAAFLCVHAHAHVSPEQKSDVEGNIYTCIYTHIILRPSK